jgi:CRP-like cAMP-binding protein
MVPLENSRFAGQLARAEQEFLQQHVQIRRFVDGQSVFREGARADGLYVVRSGHIDISVSSGPAREHLLGRMEPGDYFGEMAVFDGRERSASATSHGDCELYFVPSSIALSLLERSPMFAAALVRDASLRTRDFNRRFLRESLRAERLTLVERLARTIVHDFRNPLNVIGIAADIAAQDTATTAARRSARDRVRKQVEVLNSLMQELLDFTRTSQPGVIHAKISYQEVMRGVLLELEAEASRRGFVLEIQGELPDVVLRARSPTPVPGLHEPLPECLRCHVGCCQWLPAHSVRGFGRGRRDRIIRFGSWHCPGCHASYFRTVCHLREGSRHGLGTRHLRANHPRTRRSDLRPESAGGQGSSVYGGPAHPLHR